MFKIDKDKLEEVVRIVNQETDPAATNHVIEVEICADWNEGVGHQNWIDTSTAREIADWLASFYTD